MNNRRIILEVSDAHRIALSHKEFALLYCEVFPSMQGYYKVDFYTLTNDDDLINRVRKEDKKKDVLLLVETREFVLANCQIEVRTRKQS